ncbi:hypothetical protein JCM18900_12180 [Psychrobacter sp. JCM 18900]|nr:hypothetical protein JCM18900_12180 [Psychrobacter sp. JCM 18900]
MAVAEITVSETSVKSLSPVGSTLDATNSLAAVDCIKDDTITATELTKTRDNGPFSISTKHVSRQSANGFAGGTIHYPTDAASCGLLGGIAVVPGYVSYESSIKWWGPRLASWGFVVITINTSSIYDHPDSRAEQLSAALDHLLADETVGHMIDQNRLGAIGWSMGGGGALRLATERSTVQASLHKRPITIRAMARWIRLLYSSLVKMTVSPRIKKYTNTFYQKADGPKMKVEINNGSHFCASHRFNEKLLSKPAIAWMQRYINGDTRFDKFLCGNESYKDNPRISAYDYEDCL